MEKIMIFFNIYCFFFKIYEKKAFFNILHGFCTICCC